jgi:hypothetical protein
VRLSRRRARSASETSAKIARRRNALAWPTVSIANPVKVGAMKLENENPSASQPKFAMRSPFISPTACCTQMWKSMKLVPTMAETTKSVAR